MDTKLDISPELSARIDALAARTTLSRADIIREALEEGRSLEWQEEWLKRIGEGLAAAERGDFASDEEMSEARNRYRKA